MIKLFKKRNSDEEKYNVLESSIFRIVLNVGLPLMAVQLFSILVSSYTNEVYSQYLGKIVFLVSGVLGAAIGLFSSMYASTASSAWIRSAATYSSRERRKANKALLNSTYSVVIMAGLCILLLVVAKNQIFALMHVPAEIMKETEAYYYVQVFSMPIAGISSICNTVLTATSGKGIVFLENLINTLKAAIVAGLFVAALGWGYWGWLLGAVPVNLLHIVFQVCLLRKKGILADLKPDHFKPDFGVIMGHIKYGFMLYLQLLLCSISETLISIQSNKYLDMDTIATVSILLPITGANGICGTLCSIIVPQNYGAGKTERLKKFIYGAIAFITVYSAACTIFYMTAGEWYFSTLFDDPAMIALGKEYWFWYGLSVWPVALISVIRMFFDGVGLANISMLSGVGELVGRFICAVFLIPWLGNVGRFCAPLAGWGLGGLLMLVMFIIYRKRIFAKCDAIGRAAAEGAA